MAGQPGRSGGARPNSGPKPYAVKYKRQIAKTADIMGRMLPEAAQATVDLATGAYVVLIADRHGNYHKPTEKQLDAALDAGGVYLRVYRELPDVRAIQIMFERLMGKVPQPLDIRVQQAVDDVMQTQAILLRLLEEHVPSEYLAPIRDELGRVAELHRDARTAVGLSD